MAVVGETEKPILHSHERQEKTCKIGRTLHLPAHGIFRSLVRAASPAFIAAVPHISECGSLGVVVFDNADLFYDLRLLPCLYPACFMYRIVFVLIRDDTGYVR